MEAMKRTLLPLLAAALLATFVSTGRGAEGPDFTLASPGGETVTLSRFAGKKPVLLVFWATWCPYCNAAVPAINDIQSRLANRVEILALDFMESGEKVKAFVNKKKVTYPVLLDRDGKVARRYGVRGIPTYVLLDGKGRIVYFDNVPPPDLEKRI